MYVTVFISNLRLLPTGCLPCLIAKRLKRVFHSDLTLKRCTATGDIVLAFKGCDRLVKSGAKGKARTSLSTITLVVELPRPM